MIQFHSITMSNFLSVGNNPVTINLDTNRVTVITGSNGSGKTTIYDAIFYALYGKAFRRINNAGIINSFNKKELLVTITFNNNGNEYKIVRGQKPNVFEIWENGSLIPQLASVKDYQEYLNRKILKIDEKTFKFSVLIGSSNYIPFMQLTAADRRTIIENMLGLDIFTAMNIRAKQILSDINSDISNIEYEIMRIDTTINTLMRKDDTAIATVRLNYEKSIHSLDNRKCQIIEEFRAESNNIDNYKKIVHNNKLEYQDMHKKQQEHTINAAKIKGEITSLMKRIELVESHDMCPVCGHTMTDGFGVKVKAELHSEFETKKNEYESEKREMEVCVEKKRINNDLINEYSDKIDKFSKAVDELRDIENKKIIKEKEYKESISEIEKNLSENHDAEINEYKARRTAYVASLDDLNQKKELYQEILELFKDSGVKKIFIDKIVPTINSLIRKYLDRVEFNATFTFDEEFEETIRSRNRVEYQYNNFSGGEKTKMDYCLLFAFRELSKMMNCVNTNLLLVDEGDLTLDSNGIYNVMNILAYNDVSSNVFIISQRPDDYMNHCQRIIEVEKAEHFSNFKEVIK